MNIQKQIKKVLNEEYNSLRNNPILFYYLNFLNEKPVEWMGLYLTPNYENGKIIWEVFNPNDFSYSFNIVRDVIYDEFESFCNMTGTDLYENIDNAAAFKSDPSRCYVSEKDREQINIEGKKIKQINFNGYHFNHEADFDYKKTDVEINSGSIGISVLGNITNLTKTDPSNGESYSEDGKNFVNNMSSYDYDIWKDELYDILTPIYTIFSSNPRFYDDEQNWFDLDIFQIY